MHNNTPQCPVKPNPDRYRSPNKHLSPAEPSPASGVDQARNAAKNREGNATNSYAKTDINPTNRPPQPA